MGEEGLIDDLKASGFSDHEARIYLALYKLGAGTAYEVAKAASLQVPNTYNVIRSLTNRGAVRKVGDKPAQYVPIDPADLFDKMASRMTKLCGSIIDGFRSLEPEGEVSFVEIIQQQARIRERLVECVVQARSQVILKGATPLPDAVSDALVEAAGRGVQCLFVHYGDSPPKLLKAGVKCWPHEGNGVRLGMGEDYLTICCDFEKAVIHRTHPDSEAAYSENKSFVYMTSVMIRHEIYLAEIILALEPEIRERFGPGLYELRKQYSITPLGSSFEEFVANCSTP